ncbi:MarR family transcriptional regulator [Oscillospiraceae bacterium OttesenSCG-928-G22]|nr:MarR family transcriptional regulator [Oscillospiraceae bacterium OttesenSCG-928-G22]
MSQERDELSRELMHSLFHLAKLPWHTFFIPGLSPAESRILLSIQFHDREQMPLRPSDLSRHMRISPPTVTQHIGVLENAGYVCRTPIPGDKRAMRLTLTDKGRDVLHMHRRELRLQMEGLITFLGEKDAGELNRLLKKTSVFFRAEHPCPHHPNDDRR